MNETTKDEFLPFRLNEEPPVLRGCSFSEVGVIAGVSAAVFIPLWMIVGKIFLDFALMGIGVGMLSVMGSVYFGTGYVQRKKRGLPAGYFPILLRQKFERMNLIKRRTIDDEYIWSVGRTGKHDGKK